jgi:NhaA family Na+:H+ antiporter
MDRPPDRNVVQRFLAVEASAGIALLLATAAALLWANAPWPGYYEDVWTARLLGHDLRHWVDDGLMAAFFFVVGMEIRREVTGGELSSRRVAALPVLAALGGMVVPAGLYLLVNAGGEGAAGWGIPMATDIAFAVGVLVLLGDRVPAPLEVLLLALAVVDDIGAVAVIAVAYTDDLRFGWLGVAVVGVLAVALLSRGGRGHPAILLVVGLGVWWATHESGVHATIAGVALGLLLPSPLARRLEPALHPWASYGVLPAFALANAGIPITAASLGDAAGSAVTVGVVVGLVVGKVVGVLGASWVAVRLGVARLPDGVGWPHLGGMAALAGIGFTVSIFVSGLAFDDAVLVDQAKVGVLTASVIAAVVGSLVLRRVGPVSGGGA